MTQDILNEFLDDREKLAIQMFVDNELQREAVKKVLLFELYNNGVLKKGQKAEPRRNSVFGLVFTTNYDDKELGSHVRAMCEGINYLETGFNMMLKYSKPNSKVGKNENPAI